MNEKRQTHLGFRCPSCGTLVRGIAGAFALKAGMVRLKCPCGASSLDISAEKDGKVKLSVPCVYCGTAHHFVIAQSLFLEHDIFTLDCPYAAMGIGFLGDDDKVTQAAESAGEAMSRVMGDLGVSELSEMQPTDLDHDDVLPDATLWDLVNFVVRDLEEDGKADCPCHRGRYELRFTDDGIEAYCPDCGATKLFSVDSPAASEEYLSLDRLDLQ